MAGASLTKAAGGEAAALLAAMEAGVAKAVGALASAAAAAAAHNTNEDCGGSEAASKAAVAYRAAAQRLASAVAAYAPPRLPRLVWAAAAIAAGERSASSGHPAAAASACFGPAKTVLDDGDGKGSADVATIELQAKAMLGLASARGRAALRSDPSVRLPATATALADALRGARAAATAALPHEPLYHVVHDAAVAIAALARPLLASSADSDDDSALQALVFAASVVGAPRPLAAAGYLPFRAALYGLSARAYARHLGRAAAAGAADAAAGATTATTAVILEGALAFLDDGVARLDRIAALRALDAGVAPAQEEAAALAAARAVLQLQRPLLLAAAAAAAAGDGASDVGALTGALLAALPSDAARLEELAAVLACAASVDGKQLTEKAALPAQLRPLLDAARELCCAPPALEALAPRAHCALLAAAFHWREQLLCSDLLAGARARAAAAAPAGNGTTANEIEALAAVADLIEAAGELADRASGSGGPDSVARAADVLERCANAAACEAAPLVAGVALALHAGAGAVLSSAALGDGRRLRVLRALHAAFEACDLHDATLRGSTALRLALALEAAGTAGPVMLEEARRAAAAAVTVLEAGRVEGAARRLAAAAAAAAAHEEWHSVSAEPVASQELACLHADALAARARLDLALGLAAATAAAASKRAALLAAADARDAAAAVFGARTAKERRDDAAAADAAGRAPACPAARAKELAAACGANHYERALLAMATAPLVRDAAERAALLEAAANRLEEAECAESIGGSGGRHASSSSGPRRCSAAVPGSARAAPRVVLRGPGFVELELGPSDAAADKGGGGGYIVYCKAAGANTTTTTLAANRLSSEHPGTGERVAMGARARIEGLQRNQAYYFAVLAVDADGRPVGDLGPSSAPVLAALPLPLPLCWAMLTRVACQLDAVAAARRAAARLLPQFVSSAPERPLWEAHPCSATALAWGAPAVRCPPQLRAFAQAAIAHVARLERAAAAAAATDFGGIAEGGGRAALLEHGEPRLDAQLRALRRVKLLLVAAEAAAAAGDAPLAAEGALGAHALLAPLMARREPPALLRPLLVELHAVLSGLGGSNSSSDGSEGADALSAEQAVLAARALVATSNALLRVQAEPGPACLRALAPEVAQLQLRHAAALDAPLLRDIAPVGGSSSSTALPEARDEPASTNQAASRAASAKQTAGAPPPPPLQIAIPSSFTDGARGLRATTRAPDRAKAAAAGELAAARAAVLASPAAPASLGAPAPDDDWEAAVLSKLADPSADPLATCWPLLSSALAAAPASGGGGGGVPATSPRWLPLAVAVLEAAAARGGPAARRDARFAAAAEAALSAARLAARVPALHEWERWKLDEAAAAVETAASAGAGESAAGLDAAATPSDEHRRTAAAILLQHRLPVLLRRLRHIRATRESTAAARPWLARLHALLGRVSAEAATGHARAAAAQTAETPAAAAAPCVEGSSKPAPPQTNKKAPPSAKAGARPAAVPTTAATAAECNATDAANAAAAASNAAAAAAATEALRSLCRAAVLAGRAAAATGGSDEAASPRWRAVLPAARALWDAGLALLDEAPVLTSPPLEAGSAACEWELRALPPPQQPLLGLAAFLLPNEPVGAGEPSPTAVKAKATSSKAPAARGGSSNGGGASGGGSGASTQRGSGAKPGSRVQSASSTVAAAAAAAAASGAAAAAAPANDRLVPQPVPRRPAGCVAGALASACDAVVTALELMCAGGGGGGGDPSPPPELPLVDAVARVLLAALRRAESWRSVLALGQRLADARGPLSDSGDVLSLMLDAAARVGADPAPITAALAAARRGQSPAKLALCAARARARGFALPDPQASTAAAAVAAATAAAAAVAREYEKAAEQLRARGDAGHLCLALNELGDARLAAGDRAAAALAWSNALDALLGPHQSVANWRAALGGRTPAELLGAFGAHGLLLGGAVLCGKLLRFGCAGDASDVRPRGAAAALGAALLSAVFCCDAAHPQRPVDFARHAPPELWPGVDLFRGSGAGGGFHLANVHDVLAGAEAVATALVDAGAALEALPVVCLWEHAARHVVRRMAPTVRARIARTRALSALGLLGDAAHCLGDLMAARDLPEDGTPWPLILQTGSSSGESGSSSGGATSAAAAAPAAGKGSSTNNKGGNATTQRPPPQGKLPAEAVPAAAPLQHAPRYDDTLWPGAPLNKAARDLVAHSQLAPAVAARYGPLLASSIDRARAEWLLAAGRVRSGWQQQAEAEAVEEGLLDAAAALLRAILTSPSSGNCLERAAANVRASLLLCEVERARWRPGAALQACLEAANLIHRANQSETAAAASADAAGPQLWLRVRISAVAALCDAQHYNAAIDEAAAALKDVDQVRDDAAAARLLHLQGVCHAALSDGAAAVAALRQALTRANAAINACGAAAAGLHGGAAWQWRPAVELAALAERAGVWAEAEAHWRAACDALRARVHALGLAEALERRLPPGAGVGPPVALDGAREHVAALLGFARAAARWRPQQGLFEAESALRAAAALLPAVRANVLLHAGVWSELGRAVRLSAMVGLAPASAGSQSAVADMIRGQQQQQQQRRQEEAAGSAPARLAEACGYQRRAASILLQAAPLAAPSALRGALLEMAAAHAALRAPAACAAALRAAAAASAKRAALQLSTGGAFVPAAGGDQHQLPRWLIEQMLGQEDASVGPRAHDSRSAAVAPAATAATAPADALTLRLALRHCAHLQAGVESAAAGGVCIAQGLAEAQLLAMSPHLLAASPKLAAECVRPDQAPLPALLLDGDSDAAAATTDVDALAPGTWLAQWHDTPWQMKGASAQQQAAPAVRWATLVYVLVPSAAAAATQQPTAGAIICGECVCECGAVAAAWRSAAGLAERLAAGASGSPPPPWSLGPPSDGELNAAARAVERLLADGAARAGHHHHHHQRREHDDDKGSGGDEGGGGVDWRAASTWATIAALLDLSAGLDACPPASLTQWLSRRLAF